MLVSDFYFDLPEELIAQHPPEERGSSRMLVVDRRTGCLRDEMFQSLPRILQPGDLLILNDSRVLPARLFATRVGLTTQAGSPQPTGVVEVLLTEQIEDLGGGMVWRALVKPARKVRVGETLHFYGMAQDSDSAARTEGPGLKPFSSLHGLPRAEARCYSEGRSYSEGQSLGFQERELTAGISQPVLMAEVIAAGEFGERTLRFAPVEDFYERVGRIGHMPLPPYIRREQAGSPDTVEDRERYQTVYSARPGSAAAPTAGLHFTPEILAELQARGVEIRYITLHVGLGTFQPVRVERLEEIRLHAERYTLPAVTAEALNRALAEGRRIVAVGTTTTRALEHIAAQRAVADTTLESLGFEPLVGVIREAVEDAEIGGFGGEEPRKRIPGAKAPVPSEAFMPGLKSRHISEANLSAADEAPRYPERRASLPYDLPAGFQGGLTEARLARIEPHSGSTSIFIAPGHKFLIVSGLLTNFHLPESTLLMLVSAFATREGEADGGRQVLLGAYAHAIRERYRFYSYGDCMLLL